MRLEYRPQPPAELVTDERTERRIARHSQIGRIALDLAFPLVAFEQIPVRSRLDGLDVAVTDAAHPQRQSSIAHGLLVRIEIDRDLLRMLGLATPDQGNVRKARKRRRLDLQFDLDFLGGHRNLIRNSPEMGNFQRFTT